MNKNILIFGFVALLFAGIVFSVPYVKLTDTSSMTYTSIFNYNTSVHNNLTELQGGLAPDEYYHLTSDEYTELEDLVAESGDYLPLVGGTMAGNINMGGNSLTAIGELIMSGLTKSMDIIPVEHNLYSLGNTTRWWSKAYIKDIYASTIDTTDLTSTNIDSANLNSTNIESEVLEVENNLTLGGFVMKDDGTDMIIILT